MPTIDHLTDHKANVWRRREAGTRDEYGAVNPGFDLAYQGLGCASDGQATVLARTEAGVALVGRRQVYFGAGPVFQRRDLIEVYEGPTAPFALEVTSWDFFRGHHVEVIGDDWQGALPTIEEPAS